MSDWMKEEARRARHELFGWKNLFFGWTSWKGLGSTFGDARRNLKGAFDPSQFQEGRGLPETYAAAAARFHLNDAKLSHLESQLRLRAAWWCLAMAFATMSLMFAPISPRPYIHAMAAMAVIFLCLTRATAAYFRACQLHDRSLYDFKSWTQKNTVFKRVVASLIAIAIIVGVLLSGVAHAGPFGLHDFTPASNDPSVNALREVFGGMVDTIIGGGDPKSDANNSALGAMMVPFNAMVLTISMLFVGYATVRSIIDSASSGEFMGRQKEVSKYVIARIMLGIGLLVPLGSGYSLIQYGMMWWALQGSGAANAVNSAALDYMSAHKANMITTPQVPSAQSFVRSALRAYVCMAAMNKQYSDAGDSTRIAMKSSTYQLKPADQGWWSRVVGQAKYDSADMSEHPILNAIPIFQAGRMFTNVSDYNQTRRQWEQAHTYTAYRYSFDAQGSDLANPEGLCGSFNFANPTSDDMAESSISQSIVTAQASAVQSILQSSQLQQIANDIVTANGNSEAERTTIQNAITQLANNYSGAMVQTIQNAGGITGLSDTDWQQFTSTMKQTGWAYLPSYYNQLIRVNDNVQMALNALPTFDYARVTSLTSDMQQTNYRDAMTRLDEYLMTPGQLVQNNAQQVGGVDLSKNWAEDLKEHCITKSADARKAKESAVANSSVEDAYKPIEQCLSVIPRRAIFQFTHDLMGGNLNHIVHIKHIGDTIVDVGSGLLMANFLVTTATGNIVGSTSGFAAGVQSMGTFVTSIVLALMVFGGLAAFYIPLIPYIYGTIAFVKWLTLVIESIIAGPVFAAAHAFPEGHEATGRASPGYMLLLGLFLRPSLIVLGFYLSIIVAQPVADLINVTYGNAVMGAESDSLTGFVALLAYVGIYVVMMTTVMHSVFSLINWVPDNVLRWIGGGLQAHGVGDQEAGEMKQNVGAFIHGGNARLMGAGGAGGKKLPKPTGGGGGGGDSGGGGGGGGDKAEFPINEVRNLSSPPQQD